MHIVEFPRPVQYMVGLGMILITIALAAFTTIPVVLVVVLALAVGILPPLIMGAVRKANTTILADRLGTEVARASLEPLPDVGEKRWEPLADGQYVPIVTPTSYWTAARDAIEQKVLLIRLQGRVALGDDITTRALDGALRPAHRAMLTNQLVRLGEVMSAAARRPPAGRTSLETEAETIRLGIYEVAGCALTGVDLDALRSRPDLDRWFAAVAECENGHLATPAVGEVFTDGNGVKRVIRCCQYCPSTWSEKV